MLTFLRFLGWHIDSGIKIINDIATNPNDSDCNDDDDVYGSLQRAFLRLRFQTTMGLGPVPLNEQSLLSTVKKFPIAFPLSKSESSRSPQYPVLNNDSSWVPYGTEHQLSRLLQAEDSLKQMEGVQMKEAYYRRRLAYSYIKLAGTALQMMTKSLDTMDDTRFVELIQVVEAIYDRKRFVESSPISLDFGITNPLLFIIRVSATNQSLVTLVFEFDQIEGLLTDFAQWCKIIAIRRRAFELLKAGPKHEGLWYKDDVIALVEQHGMLS